MECLGRDLLGLKWCVDRLFRQEIQTDCHHPWISTRCASARIAGKARKESLSEIQGGERGHMLFSGELVTARMEVSI